jgi:hypothetical protein
VKTVSIVLGSVALAVVLIVAGLWIGSAWAQGGLERNTTGYCPTGSGMMGYGPAGSGMMGGSWDGPACGGSGVTSGVQQGMPCGGGYTTPGQGQVTSLDKATAAIERYMQSQGYTGLVVKEVMEFERNYYAIVSEKDTGIGAMELLVDKGTGAVGPEPGPNMMWNAKYGMMGQGGMMGRRSMMAGVATTEMTLSAAEAEETAQRWLDANLPGRTAGEADPFYGYYTLHFEKDGKIDGMLSVHGSTGDVWYHSWHGDFVQMIGTES